MQSNQKRVWMAAERLCHNIAHQTKTHEVRLVGFLILVFGMARSDHQARYCLDIFVKPFADIECDYTCQNGEKAG